MNRRDFAGALTALLKALGDNVKALPQQYPCPHCGQVSLTRAVQNSHIRLTHDLRFCCKLCGSTYITKVGLADHIKAKHMEDGNHKCDQCGKTFSYKLKLQEHMSTHRPSELLCTQCGKKFRDGANLCKHQKEQHQKLEILLHCPVCPYKHTLRRYVVYHMLRAHNIKSCSTPHFSEWTLNLLYCSEWWVTLDFLFQVLYCNFIFISHVSQLCYS